MPCSILSIGRTGEDFNELTRIQQLKAMLPRIRTNFDYVIFNTPPVLSSASMGMLASLADFHIMVIRAGTTPKDVVKQAFKILGLNGEVHVILNAVEGKSMPSYMYGYPVFHNGNEKQSIESTVK
jgi:Mrp family chromosome partitioning ATPase